MCIIEHSNTVKSYVLCIIHILELLYPITRVHQTWIIHETSKPHEKRKFVFMAFHKLSVLNDNQRD
jgi:hypothetical protein